MIDKCNWVPIKLNEHDEKETKTTKPFKSVPSACAIAIHMSNFIHRADRAITSTFPHIYFVNTMCWLCCLWMKFDISSLHLNKNCLTVKMSVVTFWNNHISLSKQYVEATYI